MTADHRRRRTAGAAAVALAGALLLGSCSAEAGPDLEVTGAYMPEPVLTDMAGGFLTVQNTGEEDDRLTKVTSDLAASVEIHETEDGTMQRIDSLPVPAGGELRLSRGGDHLMFHDLERRPTEGDTVQITLHFAHHDPIDLDVPVEATNHDPAAGGHH